MVDNSYLGSCDEVSLQLKSYFSSCDSVTPFFKLCLLIHLMPSPQVTRLMERVEATFIKHFANGNRSKGMNTLRPKVRKERHRITFFLGKRFVVGKQTFFDFGLQVTIKYYGRPNRLISSNCLTCLWNKCLLYITLFIFKVSFLSTFSWHVSIFLSLPATPQVFSLGARLHLWWP